MNRYLSMFLLVFAMAISSSCGFLKAEAPTLEGCGIDAVECVVPMLAAEGADPNPIAIITTCGKDAAQCVAQAIQSYEASQATPAPAAPATKEESIRARTLRRAKELAAATK